MVACCVRRLSFYPFSESPHFQDSHSCGVEEPRQLVQRTKQLSGIEVNGENLEDSQIFVKLLNNMRFELLELPIPPLALLLISVLTETINSCL